ncbi:metallophosphoesterase [Pantoea cypripedii]|uniref:metallophosphoesterase n=1 Tax=Pantoea cypripedii TaxID=55209 RepID=UPI002FC6ED85
MFHIWTLLPALYVCGRYLCLTRQSWLIKIIFSLCVIAGSEFHFISRLAFGSMFSPELPHAVMIFLGWFFGSIIFAAVFLLAHDIFILAEGIFRRKPRENRIVIRNGIMIVSGVLAAVGVWEAVRVPEVKRIEITLDKLPAAFDGFTLAQPTDLHASRLLSHNWMAEVVTRTNAEHPDLIVVTGDMADGTVGARRNDVAPLAGLKANYGVWAVTGNHEYYFDAPRWVSEYQRLGLRFLNNSHVRIKRQGGSIVVAGVNDAVAAGYGESEPSLTSALHNVASGEAVILLDHRPGNARESADKGISLQLSGHTHGGMISGLDRLVAPANKGYVSGQYQIGNMALYVSNGTGIWNGFPLRLGQRSEITLITLRSTTRI